MIMGQTYNSRKVLERFALPAAQKIERNRAAGIVEEKPSLIERWANYENKALDICIGVGLFVAGNLVWWFTQ